MCYQLKENQFKFGILYCTGKQTEDEMYANVKGSCAFDEFLTLLGTKVKLKGFPYFRGGLDTENDTTGKYSVYAKWQDFEIMFHVSTFLPYNSRDPQQVERKRHIGNDIVVIIFVDGDAQYAPDTIRSYFTHVFLVIHPIRNMEGKVEKYKLTTVAKEGVRPFKPVLPVPPVFSRNVDFRDFLITKLINAERAAYHVPVFAKRFERTRGFLLSEFYRKWCHS